MDDKRIVDALVKAHQKNPRKISVGLEFERNDFSGYGEYMNEPKTTGHIEERSFYIGNQELPFYSGFEKNFNSAEHIPLLRFLVEEAFPQEIRDSRHYSHEEYYMEDVQDEFRDQLKALERKHRRANRNASEVVRNIEGRIARLEKSSSNKIRVKQITWEDDTKEVVIDVQTINYTFKELHTFLSDLEHCFLDRSSKNVMILAGYGDWSGNLIEIHIKDKSLLNLLIAESFKGIF